MYFLVLGDVFEDLEAGEILWVQQEILINNVGKDNVRVAVLREESPVCDPGFVVVVVFRVDDRVDLLIVPDL